MYTDVLTHVNLAHIIKNIFTNMCSKHKGLMS